MSLATINFDTSSDFYSDPQLKLIFSEELEEGVTSQQM